MTTESVELLRGTPVSGTANGGAGVVSYVGPYYPIIDRLGAKPLVIEATGPGTIQLLRGSTLVDATAFPHGAPITVGGAALGPWTSAAIAPIQQQEWSEWSVDAVFWLALTPNSATPITGGIRQ